MSYTNDVMIGLSNVLRDTKWLKEDELKMIAENKAKVFKKIMIKSSIDKHDYSLFFSSLIKLYSSVRNGLLSLTSLLVSR